MLLEIAPENREKFASQLADTLKQIAMPALAGAAGTGALTSYVASQSHPQNETPGERRRRIVRQALLGGAMGGTAGAALPLGLETLAKPFTDAGTSPGLIDSGVDSALGTAGANALPLGVGALGGAAILKSREGNQNKALAMILKSFPKTEEGAAIKYPTNALELRVAMKDPAATRNVMSALANKLMETGAAHQDAWFKANELLQEAGSPGVAWKDIPDLFPRQNVNLNRNLLSPAEGGGFPVSMEDQRLVTGEIDDAAKGYLGRTNNPITRAMSGLVGKPMPGTGLLESAIKRTKQPGNWVDKLMQGGLNDPAADQVFSKLRGINEKGVGLAEKALPTMRRLPTLLAEATAKYLRPSVGYLNGGIRTAPKLVALMAAMAGANQLQKRLQGQ